MHKWEAEYRNPKLVTLSQEATRSFKDFVRWLRRVQNVNLDELRAIDMGCGNGKHSIYLAEQSHANIIGIDISETAIEMAIKATEEKGLANQITYHVGSIGKKLTFEDSTFTLVIDATASHSLGDNERHVYMNELVRIMAKDGYIFLRTLCKDGDANAKKLLDKYPADEIDSYRMPGTGFIERVYSEEKLRELYEPFFDILHLKKEEHYTKMNGRSYKRLFWVMYGKRR